MHVYRWDLDKTYLQTDFDSLRGLVRSATEPASAKRAVPGATAIMVGLGANPDARIHIVSGSPLQMRAVLEQKLQLDGVRYEALTLKDNLGNLARGRLRAVRGQFGYKLPELLRGRLGLGRAVRETLFGDDAEADALVYSVYADAIAGRLSARQVARIMEAGDAYPDAVADALSSLERLATADAVDRIFIRLERRMPAERFSDLGRRVVPVHSWWQAALVLMEQGHLDPDAALGVLSAVMDEDRLDTWSIAALTQDMVRRGHVRPTVLDGVRAPETVVEACRTALARLGPGPRGPNDDDHRPDYVSLVRKYGRSKQS